MQVPQFQVLHCMSAKRLNGFIVSALILFGQIEQSWAQSLQTLVEENSAALSVAKSNLDMVWVLVAAGLVLLMQVGFMLLEAGMVRSKNSINVAQKNMLDFTFTVIIFACVGFMVAFSSSNGFWFGTDFSFFFLAELDAWSLAFFVFQVMFCGTAATIVSGAVAERMPLKSYILGSIIIAAVIYPVFVHWAWGSALVDNESAILARLGFVDFAGSTVVHGTGAWVALAACILIGPRKGRFDENGQPMRIQGHSPVLATAGAFLLFVGWIGFNGGSTLEASSHIASIVANTVAAAASGTAAGHLVSLWQDNKVLRPEKSISGLIGGLVAVTAGCAILDIQGAFIIGALGGTVAVSSAVILEKHWKIDDAVGAIGVHGFAGVIGTIGLALLAPESELPLGNRWDQLFVQTIGVLLNFIWAFGLGYVAFSLIASMGRIRVDAASEMIGLNDAEHGTRIGIGHVEDAFDRLVQGRADLSLRLDFNQGDEAERLSQLFNALMDTIEDEETTKSAVADKQRVEEEAERLSALANATFEAIVICVDGKIVDGNTALEDLIGLKIGQLANLRLEDLVVADARDVFATQFEASDGAPYESRMLDSDGTPIPVEVRSRDITYRGNLTKVAAIVDLRDRKIAEEKIRYLAQHDPLTGLPNRAVFSRNLEHAVQCAETNNNSWALLLIDLDHFKDVNDLHGHAAGDHVIRETAQRLKNQMRGIGSVARLGGDEFAIILDRVDFNNQIVDFAHRLTIELSRPITNANGPMLFTGASVGLVISPQTGLEPAHILSQADTALYRAKGLGRNTYCVFEPGMDEENSCRRLLEADLATAIEEEQFELYFQPRLGAASAVINSYEALIRWNHPDKGVVRPDKFISVAEDTGKIIPIGTWVIREACRIATQQLVGKRVSVNVCPLQFREKNLVETIGSILEETGLAPQLLEIEITENVLMEDDERALSALRALKKLGCQIALDDFGTGYSSLSYLSRFPFDCIKIDRSFINEMHQSENAGAIVETIIRLGQATGMTIVAEGVEEVDQLKSLIKKGCDEIQGYLVGRPVPVSELQHLAPDIVLTALGDVTNMTNGLVEDLRKTLVNSKRDDEKPEHENRESIGKRRAIQSA